MGKSVRDHLRVDPNGLVLAEIDPRSTPGRHRRRWRRGIGASVLVVLAVAGGMLLPALLRGSPVARSAPPPRPPAAPTGLGGHAFCVDYDVMGMTVHWNAVNTPAVDGYVVYRTDTPDAWPIAVASIYDRAETVYVDRTLHPGDRPSYYVRAIAGKRASVPTYSIRPASRGFCLYGTG